MSTGFDFFEGTRSESKAPQVTVRRSGQMVLTPLAAAMLGADATHVQFGFDADTRTVALRPAPKGAKGRYRLRAQANGSSLVDGRRFLAHYGVEIDKARTFPAKSFGGGMVGFRFGKGDGQGPAAAKEVPPTAAKGMSTRTGKRKAAASA